MRNLKKVLSLVLCVAMMLSVMVMSTGAAFPDQDKIQNAEAVDMATALGIIDGYEDGTFRPAENIERGEAVKMISAMLNGGRDAVQETTESSYTDVLGSDDAWANKYIEYCTAQGIVSGVGEDRFAPASDVTGTQLAKMLLVSLGYDADKEAYQGTTMWAVNVNTDAVTAGLYAGIESVDMNAALTRDNAAQMIWNALQAETVRYSLAGQAVKTGDTLLETAFGDDYAIDTGVMAQVYYNQDKGEYTYSIVDVNVDRNSWWNVIGGGTFMDGAVSYTTTDDYSDLFAMNVTVLHDGNNALLIRVNEGGTVVEGNLGDIDEFTGGTINASTSIRVNGQSYRLDNVVGDAANVTIAFNGFDDFTRPGAASNAYTNPTLEEYYSFRAIDLDGGGDIDLFVVYPYVVLKTDLVKTDSFRINELQSTDAYLTATGQQDTFLFDLLTPTNRSNNTHPGSKVVADRADVVVNGTIATDGYVMAVPATFTATGMDTYTVLTAQSAAVTNAADRDRMISLGGTEYNGTLLSPLQTFLQISVGKDYSYIEVNGYLFIMDGTGIVPAASNYTVVTGVGASSATTTGTYQTDLLLTTGETIKVDAKVMRDNGPWWNGNTNDPANYTAQPNIGVMYTYFVNSDGDYELTRVADGNAADTTSVFDYQEVYKVGARLADENRANNDGVEDRFGTNTNGTPYFVTNGSTASATTAGEKWTIDDDAVIFAFIDRDAVSGTNVSNNDVRANEYCVLTGADLKNLDADVDVVNWAFTGADIQSQGVPTVQMGYVYLTAHPLDTTAYVYLNDASNRTLGDGHYVYIDVKTDATGEITTLQTPEYLRQNEALLVSIYNGLQDDINRYDGIVEVILNKDGKLVGFNALNDVDSSTVATYNGETLTTTDNGAYIVTDDTVIINTGDAANKIQSGESIWYLLDENGEDLLLIVYG